MAADAGLAMGWAEWASRDGVALAELVRTRQVSAQQVATQAAVAVARLNPKLEAVIELFDDVRVDPDADGPDKLGKLYGVPIFLKDLGSGLKGRKQDFGFGFHHGHTHRCHRPCCRELPACRPCAVGPLRHAGIRHDLRHHHGLPR